MRRALPEEESASRRAAAAGADTPRRGPGRGAGGGEGGGGARRARPAGARREAGRGEARGAGFEEEKVREVPFVAAGEYGEDGEEVSCVARLRAAPALETRAPGVEYAPASHRLDGRRPPEDEAISGARGHRRLQRDLKEAFRARHERAFAGSVRPGTRPEKVNAPGDIGGPEMNAQARAVGEGASDGRQPGDLRREHGGGLEPSARRERLSPVQGQTFDPGEVPARPFPGPCLPALLAVHFDSPHAHVVQPGKERERVQGGDTAAVERSRSEERRVGKEC